MVYTFHRKFYPQTIVHTIRDLFLSRFSRYVSVQLLNMCRHSTSTIRQDASNTRIEYGSFHEQDH